MRDVADTTREDVLLAMSQGDYEEAVREVSDGAIAQDDKLRGMVATAHFMLGVDFHEKSEIVSGDERECALHTAIDHYKNGLAIKPDMYDSLYNWGNALSDLAKAKGREDAPQLLELARQKYAEAIAIKPDGYEALENWGNALASLANVKGGMEAERLFFQAEQKHCVVLALTPDHPTILYNLACLNGLRRDETACRTWLTRCLSIPHPNAKHFLTTDTDLDAMRDKPWFQEMLAAL